VAAYNAGPTTVAKTVAQLGGDADPLTLMECMPAQETRVYVQRVLAGYWTYRKMFGQASPSLDAIASGDRTVDERLDYLGQADRGSRQVASDSLQIGMR